MDLLEREPNFPVIQEGAFHGLAGEIVRAVSPLTEAHEMAILAQLFAGFGAIVGQDAWFQVGEGRHYLKTWPVLVGRTSKARKGTSRPIAERFLMKLDYGFVQDRIMSGLSSGEGLIYAVRDEVTAENYKGEQKVVDPGAPDKRLLVIEEEFAAVLKVVKREGSTLSPTVRLAWDTDQLRILTKNSPNVSTGATIVIVGHITKDELLRHLDDTEVANGFANRFLWLCVDRTKLLPSPTRLPEDVADPLIERLVEAKNFARSAGLMTRSADAESLWIRLYRKLAAEESGFLVDAILARAEAQIMRLACLYALLDCSAAVEQDHLTAAWWFWQYAVDSVRYIFGDRLGDPLADKILEALRDKNGGYLDRTQIHEAIGRNYNKNRLRAERTRVFSDALFFLGG